MNIFLLIVLSILIAIFVVGGLLLLPFAIIDIYTYFKNHKEKKKKFKENKEFFEKAKMKPNTKKWKKLNEKCRAKT